MFDAAARLVGSDAAALKERTSGASTDSHGTWSARELRSEQQNGFGIEKEGSPTGEKGEEDGELGQDFWGRTRRTRRGFLEGKMGNFWVEMWI
jgi:hypothetical protein